MGHAVDIINTFDLWNNVSNLQNLTNTVWSFTKDTKSAWLEQNLGKNNLLLKSRQSDIVFLVSDHTVYSI